MKEQGAASFYNFEIFIKSFEYNYPYKYAVLVSINYWKNNLQYLKKEILENLIVLNTGPRKSYLKRVRLDCEHLMENAHTQLEELSEWLEKYETTLWEAVDEQPVIDTQLNKILSSAPESFQESLEKNIPAFYSSVRHNFYNYFYGYYLEQALQFIGEQEEPDDYIKTLNQVELPKLKSNLTVAQFAYLFKLLMDEELFEYKHKTDVYKFLAANFETKKSSNISADSVKNHMDSPDVKNIDVVYEKIIHMLQTIKKDKENIGI